MMYIDAINFFKRLQGIDENLEMVIAGGFCRDRLYGVDFKDVDIWVNKNYSVYKNPTDESEKWFMSLCDMVGDNSVYEDENKEWKNVISTMDYGKYDNSILDVSSKVTFRFEGINYEIMFMEKSAEVDQPYGDWLVNQFDNTLNEVYYDVDFNTTNYFDQTMNNGPIYIKNFVNTEQMLSNFGRAIKFKDKLKLKNNILIDPDIRVDISKRERARDQYGAYSNLNPFLEGNVLEGNVLEGNDWGVAEPMRPAIVNQRPIVWNDPHVHQPFDNAPIEDMAQALREMPGIGVVPEVRNVEENQQEDQVQENRNRNNALRDAARRLGINI